MNKKLLLGGVVILIIIAIAVVLAMKKFPVSTTSDAGGASQPVSSLLAKAKEYEAKGNVIDARAAYQKLIGDFSNSADVMNWQKKVEDMNIKLLFSPAVTSKSTIYEIKPGDTLTKIAQEFKTTVELIKKSNNIVDDKIMPGRKIKVWTAPFSILVDKSQNMLILKSDEDIIKTYIVATGANNSTPVGTFKIVNKLIDPTWFKAGAVVSPDSAENILGSRWLGLNIPGYGIHGTTDPQSLGRQVTQGCVRMANSDVEELYAIVPAGTEVAIVD